MARKKKTDTFELLCGYLDPIPDSEPRKEGEGVSEFYERTHELHTEVTVCELDHDIDKDLANREVDAVELLSRHLVQVGTITDPRKLREEVAPKLLKGDYDYALLRSRMLSLGDIYDTTPTCPSCNEELELEVDLGDISTVDMPDPYARVLEYTTDDGIETVWRHVVAEDIDALADILEDKDDEIRQVMGLRLVSIDGITPRKELSKRGRLGRDGSKAPTPEQHTREAVRMLERYEISHREKEQIRVKLNKMIGYPKLVVRHRCKFCRHGWNERLSMEPSFFTASSAV